MSGEREEQLILRFSDKDLATRIKGILAEDPILGSTSRIELRFDEKGEGRTGTFTLGQDSFRFILQDLPTVVESFKTYDDINLVKTTDIGQMILVGSKEYIEQLSNKSRHGVTPPMRDARKRLFAKPPKVDAAAMKKLEEDLLLLASGTAPSGMEFIDVEEEYVVDEETGQGSWRPVSSLAARGNATAATPPAAKKQKAKQAPSEASGPPPDVEEF